MRIEAADVEALALGGAFLATGGGGDTLIGELSTIAALERYGPVELIDAATLADDALVVAVGASGSPTIMQEKPGNGYEVGWALAALERHLGRSVDALIAFEAGGMNALLPIYAAAARQLPVLDADGMGRAFPELQMESFSIYGIAATPLAAAVERGDLMLLDRISSPAVAEQLVRQYSVVAGGGQCVSAEHPMTGAEARRVSILGTISLCLDIGRLLLRHGNRIDAFLTDLSRRLAATHYGEVRLLYRGKVTDVSRQVRDGYDFAAVRLAAFGVGSREPELLLDVKNEYLMALLGDQPLALTPDLICVLDNESGRPITAETIRYGQRVTVVGIGAPALMRTPRALEVVAPANFGFDRAYVPLEKLPKNSQL